MTSQIQAQIIFEQERQAGSNLPNTVLTNLIQASSQTLKQLRTSLLPLDSTARLDSEIERRMMLLIERGVIGKKQGMWLLEQLLSVQSPPLSPEELKLERALAKRGTPTRSDVKQLSAQIAELTREVQALAPKTARRTRRSKRE